jgi:hypothetical protein
MAYDDSRFENEDGEYIHSAERLSAEDIKDTAELVSYLEREWGVNSKRMQAQVRTRHVHLQGNVDSKAIAQEIERNLKQNSYYKGVDCFLSVLDEGEEY